MSTPLPTLLVPGLLCTPDFYAAQLAAIWRHGPVSIVRHADDDDIAAVARRILAEAPARFALAGHSFGGYIALEIMRQAGARVARLALIDTAARADTAEQTARRQTLIALAGGGRFADIADLQFPQLVHPDRHGDAGLRARIRKMANDTGADAFIRQQRAIISRPDSRPGLAAIRCPTLVVVGDHDELTPPDRAAEIATAIPGARLVTIANSGHMTAMEQPDAVTAALADWLA
jgi:pimeloyl-ACP methyl ester carboxylesterase